MRKGQPVCVVETSKSAIEIESPGDGTLCQLAREGDEVELGSRIAAIVAERGGAGRARGLAPERAAGRPRRRGRAATRKAIELAAEHGIDLGTIEKEGFITAEDVEALVVGPVGDDGHGRAARSEARSAG